MRRLTAVLIAIFVCGWAAHASPLADGDMELNFSFDWSDTNFDSPGTDVKTTDLTGQFGYLLTDHHEVGGLIDYSKTDVSGAGDTDSTGLGVFYEYNFKAGTNMNPYADAHYIFIGGDAGDFVDNQYGLAFGIKLYPWDHGGFNFGVGWDQSKGASNNPDASTTSLFGGILVKWGSK